MFINDGGKGGEFSAARDDALKRKKPTSVHRRRGRPFFAEEDAWARYKWEGIPSSTTRGGGGQAREVFPRHDFLHTFFQSFGGGGGKKEEANRFRP